MSGERQQASKQIFVPGDKQTVFDMCVKAGQQIGTVSEEMFALGSLVVKTGFKAWPPRNPVKISISVIPVSGGQEVRCEANSWDGSIGFDSPNKSIAEFCGVLSKLMEQGATTTVAAPAVAPANSQQSIPQEAPGFQQVKSRAKIFCTSCGESFEDNSAENGGDCVCPVCKHRIGSTKSGKQQSAQTNAIPEPQQSTMPSQDATASPQPAVVAPVNSGIDNTQQGSQMGQRDLPAISGLGILAFLSEIVFIGVAKMYFSPHSSTLHKFLSPFLNLGALAFVCVVLYFWSTWRKQKSPKELIMALLALIFMFFFPFP